MTIAADSNGVVTGSFTIPANVLAGTKQVVFSGAGGATAQAVFVGQGSITDEVLQKITTEYLTEWLGFLDPVAETFTVPNSCQIGALDLWFTAAGSTKTVVQIRNTVNGFPGTSVLGEVTLAPASIVTNGGYTRCAFASPVALRGGTMYCIVVLTNNAVTAVNVAQLGKFDAVHQQWVTSQPYQVGTLFTSSNGQTWSVSQDQDLTFVLHKAVFTATSRTLNLGSVAVTAATDLMLLAIEEKPSPVTYISYTLTLPDGTQLPAANKQPIRLSAAVTGNIAITATLHGDAGASPVLAPGMQLVAGSVGATGTYVTEAIPAGTNVNVKVIYDALLPAGASVLIEYKPTSGGSWTTVPNVSSANTDNGYVTLTHQITGVTATAVQVRFTLSGTTSGRPNVKNIRCMTI